MIDAGYDFMLNNLDLKGGVFEVPGNLPALMDDFVSSIVSVSNTSKVYVKSLENYLYDLDAIKSNIEEFQGTYNRVIVQKKLLKPIQSAVIDEVIDQYSENGLNKHFATPLRNTMYGNVLAGMSQKEARQYLREYIAGGQDESGKLKNYLTQTAQQGADSYSGAIHMKLKKEFKYTGYIISGSLIDTSSKQCIYAVETSEAGYLSFADWEKVLDMAKKNKQAKLIEGTTIDNLPLNKLHWGCRHEFTPVIKQKT